TQGIYEPSAKGPSERFVLFKPGSDSVVGEPQIVVTRADLIGSPVTDPAEPPNWVAGLKSALPVPKITVVQHFVAQVGRLVAPALGDRYEPTVALRHADESDGAIVEHWTGHVVSVEGDNVWAQFLNEDDDREED